VAVPSLRHGWAGQGFGMPDAPPSQQQQQQQQALPSQQQQLQQQQQQLGFMQNQQGGVYMVPMMMPPQGGVYPGWPQMQDGGQGQPLTTAMLPATTAMMPTLSTALAAAPVMQGAMPTSMMPAAQLAPMAAQMARMAPVGQPAPWVSDPSSASRPGGEEVVQGQVLGQGEEFHQLPVARGIPEASESMHISAAGKQLFGEAFDGDHWEKGAQAEGRPLSGMVDGPMSSPGSVLHGTGHCNPCAWFWKPRGCAVGLKCDYCHLCPEGELKRRKKLKIQEIKSGAREPVNPRNEVRPGVKGGGQRG